jgi:hypothetical protein
MLIDASVKSKLAKRGTNDKIAGLLSKATKNKVEPDLRDMVGKLELNADCPNDYFLLRSLYAVVTGTDHGGGGRIIIYDRDGIKLADYIDPVSPKCTCKTKTHSKVCVEVWKKENKKQIDLAFRLKFAAEAKSN